ncbi:MAG: DUF5131 family protein [Eubacteriales bacterium]
MHKTKIDWADATWNPLTGCFHQCPYCYAEKMSKRFSGDVRLNLTQTEHYQKEGELYTLEKPFPARNGQALIYPFGFAPTYHKYRLDDLDKWKNGVNIFVCSMADMFGAWVPEEWILEIFRKCQEHPQHNYLFLTKNPKRYQELDNKNLLPQESNFWYGTSITNNTADQNVEDWFRTLTYPTFLSIEPIMGEIDMYLSIFYDVDWIIVGAESGNRKGKVKPEKEWIDHIAEHCKSENIPLFMKGSLEELMGRDFTTEFPSLLKSNRPSQKLSACCLECQKNLRKADMTAILSREGRQRSTNTEGYVCEECFGKLREGWAFSGF